MAVLAVVTAAGPAFVEHGSLAVADLVAFLVVAVGLPKSILPAVTASQGVRKGRMGAANIERLLSRSPLPVPERPKTPRCHGVGFDRVSFSYDGVTNAVEDVSAVCPPGRVTAIVGPSGAGKTTLASLLPRFYDVADGAVRIGGVDVRSIPSSALLHRPARRRRRRGPRGGRRRAHPRRDRAAAQWVRHAARRGRGQPVRW